MCMRLVSQEHLLSRRICRQSCFAPTFAVLRAQPEGAPRRVLAALVLVVEVAIGEQSRKAV